MCKFFGVFDHAYISDCIIETCRCSTDSNDASRTSFDANGAAETGLHLLTFTLYDAETGGSSQWTETLAVQFNNGTTQLF